MSSSVEHQRLLYKIAQSYYLENRTQNDIGHRFGLSRIKVSRLLKQARESHIVNITLNPPPNTLTELEQSLEKVYGLEEVRIVMTEHSNVNQVSLELAPAAAECLLRRLKGGEIVGVTWGKTIMSVINALPQHPMPDVRIVQITGGLGLVVTLEHSTELARQMAGKLSAALHLIPAPGVATDRHSAEILRNDKSIRETLALAAKADIAILGIGRLAPDTFLMQDGSVITQDDFDKLTRAGAVGDIALRYLDREGRSINDEFDGRIIGLTLDELRQIPCVIGVAGGKEKHPVVQAALKSGVLDVLITDHHTGEFLIENQ